ncbi:hypothetical protein HYFRA_00009567 [Hymenoscyphus fraxineus]|uniref:Uncharacterized protein n=1 Tax=Hymenoscyphus fraxineus TaxID=746836 RepID=A0A9N9PUH0_9HELO|nr:hypothetical protein HYFRA_00009567 [Hymenoscyphus fraxineus]
MQFITIFALSLAALATATPANEYRSVLAPRNTCCCAESDAGGTCLGWICGTAKKTTKREATALETRAVLERRGCCRSRILLASHGILTMDLSVRTLPLMAHAMVAGYANRRYFNISLNMLYKSL